MKTTTLKMLTGLALALILQASLPANAKETVDVRSVLKAVRAPELPAKAADLVFKAASSEQEAVTISVVQAAIALRPASAPAVVGAIAKVAPHRASLAASTAIALVPKLTAQINKASLSAVAQKQGSLESVVKTDEPAAGVAQAAPRVGTPFVPVPPDAPEVTPGNTTNVPPGGRDYSAP